MNDMYYLSEAKRLAENSLRSDEIPVGAVVVRNSDGLIIGRGYNRCEEKRSPLCHAEIIAINEACDFLGGWRLCDCTLYVTLEPCPMCMGAVINSQLSRIVYGTKNRTLGSCRTVIDMSILAKNTEIVHDADTEECSLILKKFFGRRRKESMIRLTEALTDDQLSRFTALSGHETNENDRPFFIRFKGKIVGSVIYDTESDRPKYMKIDKEYENRIKTEDIIERMKQYGHQA